MVSQVAALSNEVGAKSRLLDQTTTPPSLVGHDCKVTDCSGDVIAYEMRLLARRVF